GRHTRSKRDWSSDVCSSDLGHAASGGRDGQGQLGLAAVARVDQAGGALVGEGVVEAGLVAGDADVDLVGTPLGDLGGEGGVGQQDRKSVVEGYKEERGQYRR